MKVCNSTVASMSTHADVPKHYDTHHVSPTAEPKDLNVPLFQPQLQADTALQKRAVFRDDARCVLKAIASELFLDDVKEVSRHSNLDWATEGTLPLGGRQMRLLLHKGNTKCRPEVAFTSL